MALEVPNFGLNIDLNLYVFNGHGNIQVLTFGFYLDFLGCKEIFVL